MGVSSINRKEKSSNIIGDEGRKEKVRESKGEDRYEFFFFFLSLFVSSYQNGTCSELLYTTYEIIYTPVPYYSCSRRQSELEKIFSQKYATIFGRKVAYADDARI